MWYKQASWLWDEILDKMETGEFCSCTETKDPQFEKSLHMGRDVI